MANDYKFRQFEEQGIYISLTFFPYPDTTPGWRFSIDTVKCTEFTSVRFDDFETCELVAIETTKIILEEDESKTG